jgi:hypothetical protein
VLLLNGASALVRLTWESVADALTGTAVTEAPVAVAGPAATCLVGLLLWLAHWSGWAVEASADDDVRRQDVRSILRPVYLFLSLGLSIGFALTAAARILFFVLGRLLGVERPGGVGRVLLVALGGPVGTFAVYGVSWLYHRRALAAQARAQPELPRQAGVRRLYTYLVSLIALGLAAAGAGGLLWTLADGVTNDSRTIGRPDWWREQVSLYATLLAVGLPVWLIYWGPIAAPGARRWTPEEAGALARRLYLYLILLAGVLALLGSGAAAAKQLLDLALGEQPSGGVLTNLARALAVAAVAGVVVFYHQRVLRADLRAVSGLRSPDAAPPGAAGGPPVGPPVGRPFGVVYHRAAREESEWFATADEANQALARIRGAGDGVDWAALVRVLDAPPGRAAPTGSDGASGPAAPEPQDRPPEDRAGP